MGVECWLQTNVYDCLHMGLSSGPRSQAASGGEKTAGNEATFHRKRPGNDTAARAASSGTAGFSSHACALQYHPELLDRAQLTEQLSHIQSELAAGTQIHYNTCAEKFKIRAVCVCLN